MYENVSFFQPRQTSVKIPQFCTCNELTAGLCSYCVMPMPAYNDPSVPAYPSVQLSIKVDTETTFRILRDALAKLLRQFADREAGPVGVRLNQIADVFVEQN
jgi:hypothetical protein